MADGSQKKGLAIGIETNPEMRSTVRDCLKSAGFEEVQMASTIEEVWPLLRKERRPDWIVSSFHDDPKYGTAQLISLLIEKPELKGVQITLLLSDEECKILPSAFEMSLTSFFRKPFIPDQLTEHLYSAKEKMENGQPSWQVAAAQLREYLKNEKMFDDWLRLEQAIMDHFPPTSDSFVNLARAQVAADRLDDAAATIQQAKLTFSDAENDDMQDLAKSLEEKGHKIKEDAKPFAESIDLNTVLIVESDSSQATAIKTALESLAVKNINVTENADDTEAWLTENASDVNMIIASWNMPGISGSGLLQRMTDVEGLGPIPLIVTTSGLANHEKNLLKELGVADTVSKPVSDDFLKASVVKHAVSAFTGHEAKTLSRKIQNALRNKKVKMARQLLEKLAKSPDCMTKIHWQRESEVLFAEGEFEKARDKATACFKSYGEDVSTLNILGKSFLKLGDSSSALKCLNRAHLLSPENLDRICQMAQTLDEQGESEQSKELIEKAEKVDADSKTVQAAKAGIAIGNGDPKSAKKLLAKTAVVRSMITYMNNRAVSLVQSGEVEPSLELYQNALQALAGDHDKEKAIVEYNYALACIRLEKVGEAANALGNIAVTEGDPFSNKVLSLRKRVMEALQGNQQVELFTADHEKKSALSGPPLALHCEPGELRLHRIFAAKESSDKAFIKSISHTPKPSKKENNEIDREKVS
ncbi:response regulator [Oligoflexaceae bacterium]|nr:response regulator [Oligoflexaceae bacterium]